MIRAARTQRRNAARMKGRLSESPLAELAREIAEAGLSGALRLARERVKVVIYAQSGAISYARSNLRAHRLGEVARRAGLAEEEKLSSLVTEMMSDAEAGAALVESRALTREGLTQLRTRQVLDVLRPPMLWTDGVWEFDPRARLAAEDLAVRFDATELLLEAARRLQPHFCASRFSDDKEAISPAGAPPTHLQLNPVEGYVLSRLDAPARVSDLVMLCGLPAYSLALGGFVRRDGWARALTDASGQPLPELSMRAPAANAATGAAPAKGEEKDRATEKAAEADPREEVEELISRAGVEDHYQALGVGRSAPAPDIKRAYYALARRFHPDRFRRAVDPETLARAEGAFARLAQAYETLSDASARAAYDLKLSSRPSPPQKTPPGETQSAVNRQRASSPPTTSEAAQRAEDGFQRGLAAMQRGDTAGSLPHFAEAVRLAPQQARYHALYGRALMAEAHTRRQAEAELRHAVTLDPSNASYRVTLAQLYVAVGLDHRAVEELERAVALDPNNAAARQMLERTKGK
jgi:tetratricopeptide (TPR) repeat protein